PVALPFLPSPGPADLIRPSPVLPVVPFSHPVAVDRVRAVSRSYFGPVVVGFNAVSGPVFANNYDGPVVPFPGPAPAFTTSRAISISVGGLVSCSFVLNLHSAKLLDLLNRLLNLPSAVSADASTPLAPTEATTIFAPLSMRSRRSVDFWQNFIQKLPEKKSAETKVERSAEVQEVDEYVPPERPPISTCEFVVGPQAPNCRDCIPGYFVCKTHTVLCGDECFICCNFCLRVLCCKHIYCSCRPAIERRHTVALAIRRAKSQQISAEVALARLLAPNDDVPEEVLVRRLTAGARSAASSPLSSDAHVPATTPISSPATSSTSCIPSVGSAGPVLTRPLFSSSSFSGPLNFFPCPVVVNGVACPRGSFVHAPYCRFHLRSVLGLDVDESSIPDAGLGLFSLVARKGFHLVDYLGEVVSKSQIE